MQEEILQTKKQEEGETENNSVQKPDVWERRREAILDAKKELTAAIVDQIKSPKCRRDVKETIRSIADRVGHSTYQYFLLNDDDYQEDHIKIHNLETDCMKLGIDEEKQEKVDELIRELNEMECHFVANAYLAGMLDAYNIFDDFELL